MPVEQDKTLKALKYAIQMEIDGKRFYLKASGESSNELGKKLLKSLADEEDIHRSNFEHIFDALNSKEGWPKIDIQPEEGLRTLFAKATEEMGANVTALTTELDALKTAMDMESKSYDFYKSQSKETTYNAQKDFYEAVAAQERQHHLVLLDYFEYLKDPAAWFVAKEHPSLDGG